MTWVLATLLLLLAAPFVLWPLRNGPGPISGDGDPAER
jgi:hypothetical protein